ncbi:unnamed protein product [Enterobius vermicularis]|uniref:Protein Wnt n=1 Tax=Enterobius vermicularis TaxID=51028 RepID=A0A0N4VE73_ENTVE|nr:unnamed protein product [Enterobius vermicularis]
MCRKSTDLMPIIIDSAQSVVSVCQKVFADRRWNCSSILLAPNYKHDLTKGTKEQAFVYALSAAAVAHQVAKGCSDGKLPYCPCGLNSPTVSTDTTYKWKGCSDNILYGQKISREWADAPWRKKTKSGRNRTTTRRTHRYAMKEDYAPKGNYIRQWHESGMPTRIVMNQQNNDLGRQVTEESLYRKCKCHGVSSSCNVQTCWNTLPDITEIAFKLKERYSEATNYNEWANEDNFSNQRLVYLNNSPDYCVEDKRTGSYGTTMRECNVTSPGADGCGSLCCGRGYNTKTVKVEEQCQCKYVHCCYVKCKTCTYYIDKHYCK